MKTIVIGLGNPILGDDGVGWVVAQAVEEQYRQFENSTSSIGINPSAVDFLCLSLGGLSLMEYLSNYQHAILIDAIQSPQHPPGVCLQFPITALPDPSAGHLSSAHDTSLVNALQLGRQIGAELPETIEIVAIVAENVSDFTEQISPAVAAAVPGAVQTVLEMLQSLSTQEA